MQERQDRRKERKRNIHKEIRRRVENLQDIKKKGWNLDRLENYPPMDNFVEGQMREMYDYLEGLSEWHNTREEETLTRAPESGPGFYATQQGGWVISLYNDVSTYMSSGNFPYNGQISKAIEEADESNMKAAIESFKETNKKALEELNLPDSKLNYHDLYEINQGDLAENLDQIHMEMNYGYSVELECQLQYHKPTGWDGEDENYSEDQYPKIYMRIDVDVGQWKMEEEFYVKNMTELKQKVPEVLKKFRDGLEQDVPTSS